MSHLTPEDLYGLEEYAKIRGDFRAKVMEHKKARRVPIGPNATLYFEDVLTMQYQVQEMLRIERIFEQDGIAEELGAYNPLIPDGRNFKATFMVEFPEVEERQEALGKLIGIEDKVWVQAAGHDRSYAIADEDLERADDTKTSAVHFLRFELTEDMAASLKGGGALAMGIDHLAYTHRVDAVEPAVRDSLANDLT